MKEFDNLEHVSLLWPDGSGKSQDGWAVNISDCLIEDLGIEELAIAISFDHKHPVTTNDLINYITCDPGTIGYRLDIIEDLINNPNLAGDFERLLPSLDELGMILESYHKPTDDTMFMQTISRLGELELYVDIIHKLQMSFSTAQIKSESLAKLQQKIAEVSNQPDFQSLVKELPKLKSSFSTLASVTIGINLDSQFRPCEATLLSINEQRFKGASFLERFSSKRSSDSPYQGISPLLRIEQMDGVQNNAVIAVFDELNRILGSLAKPVAAELGRYIRLNSRFLIFLQHDLIFLLGAVQFLQTIKDTGMPMCRPVIVNKEARIFKVNDIYNIRFAHSLSFTKTDLSQTIVTNQVTFDENGRIFILTGPNRGGKTTYTQAIGLAQVLFQLGMFVPGTEAALSPVDAVYTHFPVVEKFDSNLGRLGEESKRLGEIFQKATAYSLILLNESLSSTSPRECLYLSRGIVAGLKLLGARTAFATHLHDLAANLEEDNSRIPGDAKIISMVSGIDTFSDIQGKPADFTQRTFKITPGPPPGLSYAKDIAARYGISLEELLRVMKERAIITENLDADSLLG